MRELAVAIDNTLRSILTKEKKSHALELGETAKEQLCSEASKIIAEGLNLDRYPLRTGRR